MGCMKHARQPIRPDVPARLLSTDEVMRRTTLSRSTLWRLSRCGAIPRPIRITPGRIAWRESDVAAWLERGHAAEVRP
jgi:prophage regulatory protein